MSLKNRDIICLALPTWEGEYMKAIVQVMSLLAKNNRVLYVDYEFTYKDVLTGFLGDKRIPVKRIVGLENRLRKVKTDKGSEVYVLTPPAVLPTNWISTPDLYKKVVAHEAKKIVRSINQAMRSLNFNKPIVINAFNPFFGLPIIGAFKEDLLVYYCYDEISMASWCSRHGAVVEHEFMQQVDLIITTSEELYKNKKKVNDATCLVKNGVNFDLFSSQSRSGIVKKEKPVVGYVGSVDNRLNSKLLEELVQMLPHHHFLFVGRVVEKDIQQRLGRFNNVEFRGAVAPQKLPQVVQSMDVGIIPFEKNKFTENIYPLKINEYLAAGLPVVKTDFAYLPEFKGVVKTAANAADFAVAIRQEMETDTMEKVNSRMDFASRNSWEARVDQLERIIFQLLEKKSEEVVF